MVNIINDSKIESQRRSIDMYAKALENAITNYQLKNPKGKNVTLTQLEKLINYSGDKVECKITKIYKSGKIYLNECSVGGVLVDYTYGIESYKDYIKLVEDIDSKDLSLMPLHVQHG